MTSDRITDEDRRAFQAWFEQHPTHRQAYADAEALWQELSHLPGRRRATFPQRATPAGALRHTPARYRSPNRQRPWLAALAASLLLVIGLGLWQFNVYDRLRADYVTAVGERHEITLADGTVVQLNTDTALAVRLTTGRRRIELYRGEAFFDVAPDKSRPFEVVSGAGTARALGTAFSVQRQSDTVIVAVTEGRVEAQSSRAAAQSGNTVQLGAGDALRLGPGAESNLLSLNVDALTAWRQGKLVFTNRPLGAVVAELDRYRPGAIVLLDSSLADQRFSGVVRLTNTDRALAALAATLPVEVIKLSSYLTVLRHRN